MLKFLVLFTVVPLVELWLLIRIGEWLGAFPTVLLVAATGFIGVLLVKAQGLLTLRRIGAELERGTIPADSLLDGLLILLGGAFLLTPGIITDILGFSMVLPFTRELVKKVVKVIIQIMIGKGYLNIWRR